MAQLFIGRKSLVSDAYGVKTDAAFVNTLEDNCWKTCASTTMVSLKFPLQDPLQAVATVATTTLP